MFPTKHCVFRLTFRVLGASGFSGLRAQVLHSCLKGIVQGYFGSQFQPMGLLGTLKGTYRVYSWYLTIPGLRAHTRGPWLQP